MGPRHPWSLPPRERGLKHFFNVNPCVAACVAPPAGAWIETDRSNHERRQREVAPPAGAWIETGELTYA